MERDKRIAVVLAIVISVILFICTVASQLIYWKLLPNVRVVEAEWNGEGYVLPKDALYRSMNGECIYYIEEKEDRFQTKYIAKEVLVTVITEDAVTVTVNGIYNPEWVYAAGADKELSDGAEVKVIQ